MMKPTLQLRLGQHLTMTPQLQQAIRLLQLSTLDLKQEIQDALDSNLMLETEEDVREREPEAPAEPSGEQAEAAGDTSSESRSEQEVNIEAESIPDELPVDTAWEDLYDIPTTPASSRGEDSLDYLSQQSGDETLHAHLDWQANLGHFSDQDLAIATAIIDGINDNGYFTAEITDIVEAVNGTEPGLAADDAIGEAEVEAVLHRIQSFDPPGVGARNLQESLQIQLRQLPESTPDRATALRLVDDYFELLAAQDETQIRRRMKIDQAELQRANALIRSLNPRPGSAVESKAPSYVEPDVFVFKRNGRWRVELNPDAAPRLRVNNEYAGLIRRADSSSDNTTLKNHLQEARWFIKSLQSRNDTLLRVASKIVEFQLDYFEHGEEAMKPLVLRDIAEVLEMHESTISRVTTQKYMHTPRGTLEFKYFFSSHVSTTAGGEASATAIRAVIKKLIAAEKPNKPLSDNKIATILEEQGIKVARRTVAKYRESMAIPPSNERKRLI